MREALKSSVHKRQITAVLKLTAGRLHTTRAWPVHDTLQGPGPYKLHTVQGPGPYYIIPAHI